MTSNDDQLIDGPAGQDASALSPAQPEAAAEQSPPADAAEEGNADTVVEKRSSGDAKAESLKQREKEIAEQKRKLVKEVDALEKRKRDMGAKESALAARERTIAERELAASEGFAQKNREFTAKLTKDHEILLKQIDDQQKKLEQARTDSSVELSEWATNQRRARVDAIEAEMAAYRLQAEAEVSAQKTRAQQQIDREREEHTLAMAEARAAVDADRKVLSETRQALDSKEAELVSKQARIQFQEEDLNARREEMERAATDRVQHKIDDLERQLRNLREDHGRQMEDRSNLERRIDAYGELDRACGGSVEETLRKLQESRNENKALRSELLLRPSAADKEQMTELLQQKRSWVDERERLLQELTQLRAERARWHTGVSDLEAQRERREVAEKRLQVMQGEMERYADDVARMRSLYEKPQEVAARIGEIEVPLFRSYNRASAAEVTLELSWLEEITAACAECGFKFPNRLVQQFHTSLKTAELSPFTVLAGVSGTGKSALPRLYAHFGGLAFYDVAVQPNWDSPQALFGFFNSIDNRYNATEMLRAIVQSQKEPTDQNYESGMGMADRVLLVLLDEMNLAHVEHYFSEQISRLGKPLAKDERVIVPIDLGAGMATYKLPLGRNILWVGTMNEDETTKSLSDKVVDRSNLLSFPRPRTLYSRKDVRLPQGKPLLPRSTWDAWVKGKSTFDEERIAIFRTSLEKINEHLEHVGRALGHRVWQSVEYYLANYPEVIAAQKIKDDDRLTRGLRTAFEDQLVLKVMPKLRGIETSGDAQRKCLDPIRRELDAPELGLRLAEDFEIACKVGYGAFVWNSARYLEAE
jgi:hypothetical protein